MERIARPALKSTGDDQAAFSEAEIAFLDTGSGVGVSSANLTLIAVELTDDVAHERWMRVEVTLRDLLSTQIKPGFFQAVSDAKLGSVVAFIFTLKPTEDNFLAVRLACLAVGYWESALNFVIEQNTKKALEKAAKRRRVA